MLVLHGSAPRAPAPRGLRQEAKARSTNVSCERTLAVLINTRFYRRASCIQKLALICGLQTDICSAHRPADGTSGCSQCILCDSALVHLQEQGSSRRRRCCHTVHLRARPRRHGEKHAKVATTLASSPCFERSLELSQPKHANRASNALCFLAMAGLHDNSYNLYIVRARTPHLRTYSASGTRESEYCTRRVLRWGSL